MMSASRVFRHASVLCAVLILAACGGGGADGGLVGSGSPTPQIDLSRSSLTFTAQQYSSVPPAPQTVTAQARDGQVFLSVSGYPADLDCNQTSKCTITVTPPAPMNSPAGTTNHTVNIRVCADQACVRELNTKTIDVTYVITPGVGLSTSPAAPNLLVDLGVTPTPFPLELTFINGSPTSWSAAARYETGSGSNWLHLTPSGNTLALTFDPLPAATFYAYIDITYSGDGWSNKVTVPLAYTVRPSPIVEGVAPNVAATNESRTVIVRGKAFDRLAQPVKFGGVDALNVTTISDTQLLVTPPPLATPGVYDVTVQNAQGNVTGHGRYVVVPPRNYPLQSIDISAVSDDAPKFPVYDAERERVYFRLGDGVGVATHENLTWRVERMGPVMQNAQIHYSTDNRKLYFASAPRTISEFDLDSGVVANPFGDFANADINGFEIMGDGRILWYGNTGLHFYDPVLQRSRDYASSLDSPSGLNHSSPDRETTLQVDAGVGNQIVPINSAVPGTRFLPPFQYDPQTIVVGRHGRRILAGDYVYDKNFTQLGRVADGGNATSSFYAISPDENRVYAVWQTTEQTPRTALSVSDISGVTSSFFPTVGLTIYFNLSAGPRAMPTVSPDGKTLFIVGSKRLITYPLP